MIGLSGRFGSDRSTGSGNANFSGVTSGLGVTSICGHGGRLCYGGFSGFEISILSLSSNVVFSGVFCGPLSQRRSWSAWTGAAGARNGPW